MGDYLQVLPILLRGLDITLYVLLGSVVVGYLIAFIAGFGRLSANPFIRKFTVVYVEVFRGTSLIVQLFWFYFVLPGLLGLELTNFQSGLLAGILGIGFNYGAYMSEVVRGAILAVPHGQYEAATALNMSRFERMRLVVFPQAVRMMLPEFGNYLIQMLKATSLVYMISLADMTYEAGLFQSTNISMTIPIYTMLLVVYFILALPLIGLTKWFERIASRGVASE
ncbi:MAG TPA: ectoine/hydroxyectoine ABC transporter permease subunit EhuC [Bacillales bacterium]|nr:ectoine/hydroxyectoine ABC transporter permease subunit EhuC [Bacillales bacterium]